MTITEEVKQQGLKWIWPVTRYVTTFTPKEQRERHNDLKNSSNPLERLWALYHEGMINYFDPVQDLDWDHFDVSGWSQEEKEAGRKWWSWRTWIEYSILPAVAYENNRIALSGCGMERTLYPSVICFETTRHREVSYMLTGRLGGYIEAPSGPEEVFAAVIQKGLSDQFYSPDAPLAPATAGLHCLMAGLTASQHKLALDRHVKNPLLQAALKVMAIDKARQAEYGWLTLEIDLAQNPSKAEKQAVVDSIVGELKAKSLRGVHSTTGLPASARTSIDAWKTIGARAGVGCLTPEEEAESIRDYLGEMRQRLAKLGIELPKVPEAEN